MTAAAYEQTSYGMWSEVGITEPAAAADWWRNMLTDQVSELQITGDMHAALAPVLVDVEEQSPEALAEQINNASDDQIVAYGDAYYSGVPMQGLQGVAEDTGIPPIKQWSKEYSGKFTYYGWAFGAHPDRRYPLAEEYHITGEGPGVYIVQAWGFPPDSVWEFVGRAKTPASAVVLARKHYKKKLSQYGRAPSTGPGYQSRVMTMQGLGQPNLLWQLQGQVPEWRAFKRHYKKAIGSGDYTLELIEADADVARYANKHAMSKEDHFEYSVAGKDVYSMNDKQLYAFVQELASMYRAGAVEGNERYRMLGNAAGQLASGILATLGFQVRARG
jgi:hypothetical protein